MNINEIHKIPKISKIPKIPRIIHQLWIGTKERPYKFMDTWKNNNPDFQYIMWDETEIKKNLKLQCLDKINAMKEINGKADIIRWEILYKYGGIFLDADSISLAPLDDNLLNTSAFASYENEISRNGLVSTVAMGFPKEHPLCLMAIKWILNNNISNKSAWQTVGPGLITRLYKTNIFSDITIFPSYYFLPVHFSGQIYTGHGKVYAHQEWGSTKKNYDKMNSIEIPSIFKTPTKIIEISLNINDDNIKDLKQKLITIMNINGYNIVKLTIIQDDLNSDNKQILNNEIENYKTIVRWIVICL